MKRNVFPVTGDWVRRADTIEHIDQLGKASAIDQERAAIEHASHMTGDVLFFAENDDRKVGEKILFAQPGKHHEVCRVLVLSIENEGRREGITVTVPVNADTSKVKNGLLAVSRDVEAAVTVGFKHSSQRKNKLKVVLDHRENMKVRDHPCFYCVRVWEFRIVRRCLMSARPSTHRRLGVWRMAHGKIDK